MKKRLVALVASAVLIGAAAGGAYGYVAPTEKLNLSYREVPLEARALDMARRLSTSLILSEEDVGNLAKRQLALHPDYGSGIEIVGARFRLSSDVLVADVNAKWRHRVPVGLTLTYRLTWANPNLIARVVEARVKDVRLPTGWFGDEIIPLGDGLPRPLQIEDVRLENGQAVVQFRKPSLSDLRSLLNE